MVRVHESFHLIFCVFLHLPRILTFSRLRCSHQISLLLAVIALEGDEALMIHLGGGEGGETTISSERRDLRHCGLVFAFTSATTRARRAGGRASQPANRCSRRHSPLVALSLEKREGAHAANSDDNARNNDGIDRAHLLSQPPPAKTIKYSYDDPRNLLHLVPGNNDYAR